MDDTYLNILEMIIIICGNSSVLQGKYASSSWIMTIRIYLILTPIVMECTRMTNPMLAQLMNAQMITPLKNVINI